MLDSSKKRDSLAKYSITALNNLVSDIDESTLDRLAFLNRTKYSTYHQYKPWNGFFEHLYSFLKNFEGNRDDLAKALCLVNKTIFFTQQEVNYIAEIVYPQEIVPFLLDQLVRDKNLGPLDFSRAYELGFEEYKNNSFFVALSDGAHIDHFRRTHRLNNDNVIPYYKLNRKAQKKILDKMKKKERFNKDSLNIFLLEDFVGTGTTFAREEEAELDGQLINFCDYWSDFTAEYERVNIVLVPYIVTKLATDNINEIVGKFRETIEAFHSNINFSIKPGVLIPRRMNIVDNNSDIKHLCDHYYDESIEDEHTKKGGGVKYGFGDAGLAVVRYNNTPNNSLYLLWNPKSWNPLFPRISRHRAEKDE